MRVKAEVLVADFRSQVLDMVEPYFWSEAEILRYLDKGQKRFCRDGIAIVDSRTDEVVRLPFKAGDSTVTYHESIVRIRTAKLESNHRGVEIKTQDQYLGSFDSRGVSRDYGRAANPGTQLEQTGEIRHMFIDYEEEFIRFSRIAENDDVLLLHVERGPINTLDSCSVYLEIKEDYHQAVLEWAYHLAFSKQDSETFDMKKADTGAENFDREVALAQRSHRKRHGRVGKVRYGGI